MRLNDVQQGLLYRPSHVRCIPTHIEVGALLQQLPHQLPILSQPILHIHLLLLQSINLFASKTLSNSTHPDMMTDAFCTHSLLLESLGWQICDMCLPMVDFTDKC